MTEKIKELLAVLDMPEEEQIQFLVDYLESSADQSYLPDQLADLAFRLRDEVYVDERCTPILRKCMQVVTARAYPLFADEELWITWWVAQAQPIHWIISSLIAKELAKEKND